MSRGVPFQSRLRLFSTAWGVTSLAVSMAMACSAQAAECLPKGPGGALQITLECVDPLYNSSNFKVLNVSPQSASQPYTKVLAEFTGTPFQVNIYLPPKEAWQRRFFQHVYPLQKIEASPGDINFAISSGGYLVNTNGTPSGGAGYRVDAAAAKLARDYALRFYGGEKPIFGYVWGGSGGSFQTIGAIENTFGVWNGAVPYVIANEASFLNYQALSALIDLALRPKLPALADVVGPGGDGNTDKILDPEERAVFNEAVKMGFPLRGFEYLSFRISDVLSESGEKAREVPPLVGGTYRLADSIRAEDPSYVEDFWTKPGYEGANPPNYLKRALVDHFATITAIRRDSNGIPTSVVLDSSPHLGAIGAIGLENWLYAADGETRIPGLLLGENADGTTELALKSGNDPALLKALSVGRKLRINNRLVLSLAFYHRHSIPASREFPSYEQYRRSDGTPIYPQRGFSAARWSMLRTSGGGMQTGRITCKTIVVGNLLDISAYPVNATGYAARVRRELGDKKFADTFRLWFNDNANHIDRPPDGPNLPRLVTYVPILYQALRDLSAWVEHGVVPPSSTRYNLSAAQISLPEKAELRGGVQPVVHLEVNGKKEIEVLAGNPVTFRGVIGVPPRTGKVVGVEWYLGDTPVSFTPSEFAASAPGATVSRTYAFPERGTYLVTLRAKSQRNGSVGDPATLENIDRVRVVVR